MGEFQDILTLFGILQIERPLKKFKQIIETPYDKIKKLNNSNVVLFDKHYGELKGRLKLIENDFDKYNLIVNESQINLHIHDLEKLVQTN